MPSAPQLTPMLRHYTEVKAQHPDAVVLYRMGDFYEVFFDDAVEIAPVLEVTLTARHKGKESETPMCGVPYHALEVYLAKLLKAGYKAAICDQVEDPAEAKGLVKREVTRVVTPGTLSDTDLLDGKEDNLLASVSWNGKRGSVLGAGAFLDISTGKFFVRRWEASEEALQDLALFAPSEVLLEEDGVPDEIGAWVERHELCSTRVRADTWFDPKRAGELLERQFGTATLRGFGLGTNDAVAIRAAAIGLAYARDTQQSELSHIRSLAVRESGDSVVLDATTLSNLEVFRNQRDSSLRGTLVGVLDASITPPGGRLLRDWLRRPARRPADIEGRLDAVEELHQDESLRNALRDHLRSVGDPARLLTRAVLGTLNPREAGALRTALEVVPEILGGLRDARSRLLTEIAGVDPAADLGAELGRVLAENPPANLKHGGVIADGVDDELDRQRSLARDSKKHLLALESREREATGIGSLKVKFNKVFGYYLEVTKANQSLVPERYVRKQTLVNAERYITPELKELEEQILGAEERRLALETEHFERLRDTIAEHSEGLSALARGMARLDVVATLAEVAARGRYVRPTIVPDAGTMEIRDGRHPVVERLSGVDFVPNDLDLDAENGNLVLLTGPNMGGKSTYLRQCALIVLMAQAGSFVPAASASIGVVDRIFTRVGASDDLTRGESTFMVEMVETAKILHQATSESLVILDEVGRGTATFDGLSLAWAIVEYLHEGPSPRTLFATHYHELTELATLLPRVVNRTMAVKEWENRIVFLHRVVPGSADKSYGLHVARLAGIPASVIERAAEVLGNLESQEYDLAGKPRLARGNVPAGASQDQMNLFAPAEEVVASVLRDLDVERLAPLAALNLLHSLKSRLGGD